MILENSLNKDKFKEETENTLKFLKRQKKLLTRRQIHKKIEKRYNIDIPIITFGKILTTLKKQQLADFKNIDRRYYWYYSPLKKDNA